jgi:hypothetical protein
MWVGSYNFLLKSGKEKFKKSIRLSEYHNMKRVLCNDTLVCSYILYILLALIIFSILANLTSSLGTFISWVLFCNEICCNESFLVSQQPYEIFMSNL